MKDQNNDITESIAIIGMAGSFPKAKNIKEFWANLKNAVNCITDYSEEELINAGIERELLGHPYYVKSKGTLDDIDLFDADFFGVGQREAELMDPQHRLLLECAWSALEDAGYDPETYKKLIGIYAGESMSSYAYLNVLPNMTALLSTKSLQAAIGNDKDSLTTTVAYHLNLKGPAITVQTSSSTSLVAVSLACQQLLFYQCDIALAGGVSAGPPLKSGYLYEEGGISSSDGKCRSFDQHSNGFVPGSGVGLVVLKRLSEAIQDRDNIWSVIKGFAINNDGNKKVSYSAPSVDAQAEVIMMAQEYAGFTPDTISYIEGHGTATKLGDPIEVAALTQAFRMKTQRKNFCAIGSVKSNIGHLDTAAGIAGLIKTILCLKYKTLVPNLHFQSPNPELHLTDSPFFVSKELSEWKSLNGPLRAGITSLGMGGTNTHVLLEEPPLTKVNHKEYVDKCVLLTLSAKTSNALRQQVCNIHEFINENREVSLDDLAYTLNVGRRPMKYRMSFVAQSIEDLTRELALAIEKPDIFFPAASQPKTVFLYDRSELSQLNLVQELFHSNPVFQDSIIKFSNLLQPTFKQDLLGLLDDKNEDPLHIFFSDFSEKIKNLFFFIFEVALASLLIHWGVGPHVQVGLGIGEFVAAVISGVMTIESALILLQSDSEDADFFKFLKLSPPKIPFFSCITGSWITETEALSSSYWALSKTNLTRIIQTNDAVLACQSMFLLKITPDHLSFKNLSEKNELELTQILTFYDDSAKKDQTLNKFLEILGQLYVHGIRIDWSNFYFGKIRYRISLPTYSFERKRFWLVPPLTHSKASTHNPDSSNKTFQPRPNLATPYMQPSSKSEVQITQIWEEAFGLMPIGVNDNFFDLGGSSLEATVLISSVNTKFRKKITLSNFYSNPTIKEIASLLDNIPEFDFGLLLDEISS